MYKGVVYKQGAKWDDGCDYSCECEDALQRRYKCTSKYVVIRRKSEAFCYMITTLDDNHLSVIISSSRFSLSSFPPLKFKFPPYKVMSKKEMVVSVIRFCYIFFTLRLVIVLFLNMPDINFCRNSTHKNSFKFWRSTGELSKRPNFLTRSFKSTSSACYPSQVKKKSKMLRPTPEIRPNTGKRGALSCIVLKDTADIGYIHKFTRENMWLYPFCPNKQMNRVYYCFLIFFYMLDLTVTQYKKKKITILIRTPW